ncbi:hypothetical protein UFOVP840_5 [uncultured Caudovirales phage]|uniref:Uncharacterized protein n=1 Tax=uncultured Caudovirales phage TaxID=2100421 RepID=A0A6J5P3H1_9CAUD|nr:hypothetical protein UFOVP840_5 [uncultured Caudovirales phage]
MSRLLIMSCSATKSHAAQPVPAVERYTGPVWQTYKAVDPRGELARLTVLSAEHGWIGGQHPVASYNRKMDHLRGRELIDRGLNDSARLMLAGLCHFGARPFSEVCIVGGHYYQAVAQELVRLAANELECFSPDVRIVEVCDQVGYMRQRLRAWLLAGAEQVAA